MRAFNFKDLEGIEKEEGKSLRLTSPVHLGETITAIPRSIISKQDLAKLIKLYEESVIFVGAVGEDKLPAFSGDLINRKGVNLFNLREVNKAPLSGFVKEVDKKGRVLKTSPDFTVPADAVKGVSWSNMANSKAPSAGHYPVSDYFRNSEEGLDYLRVSHEEYDLKDKTFVINRETPAEGKYASYMDYLYAIGRKFHDGDLDGEDDVISASGDVGEYDTNSPNSIVYPARPWKDSKSFSNESLKIDTGSAPIQAIEHSNSYNGDYPTISIFDGFLTIYNSGSLSQDYVSWDTLSFAENSTDGTFDFFNGLSDMYGRFGTRKVDLTAAGTTSVFKRNQDLLMFHEPWIRPHGITGPSKQDSSPIQVAGLDQFYEDQNVFNRGSLICRTTNTSNLGDSRKIWDSITDGKGEGVNRTWSYVHGSFVGTGDHSHPNIILQDRKETTKGSSSRIYTDYSDKHGVRLHRREGLGVIGSSDHFHHLAGSVTINDSFELHLKEVLRTDEDHSVFAATPRSTYLGNIFLKAFGETGINTPLGKETHPRAVMSPAVIKTLVSNGKLGIFSLFKIKRVGVEPFTHSILKEGFNFIYMEVSIPSRVSEAEFLLSECTVNTVSIGIDVDSLNVNLNKLGYHKNAYFDIAQGKNRLYIVFPERVYSIGSPGGDNHYLTKDIVPVYDDKSSGTTDISKPTDNPLLFTDRTLGKPWSGITVAGSYYGVRERKREGSSFFNIEKIPTPDLGTDITELYGFDNVVRINYPNFTGDFAEGIESDTSKQWQFRERTDYMFRPGTPPGFDDSRGRSDIIFYDGFLFKILPTTPDSNRFSPESLVLLRAKAGVGYSSSGSWEVVGWEEGITGPITIPFDKTAFRPVNMENNQDHLRLIVFKNSLYFIDTVAGTYTIGNFIGGGAGHVVWGKPSKFTGVGINAFSEFYVESGMLCAVGVSSLTGGVSTDYETPPYYPEGVKLPYYKHSLKTIRQSTVNHVRIRMDENGVPTGEVESLERLRVVSRASGDALLTEADYPWAVTFLPKNDSSGKSFYILTKRDLNGPKYYFSSSPILGDSDGVLYVDEAGFVPYHQDYEGIVKRTYLGTRPTFPQILTTVSKNNYYIAIANNLYRLTERAPDLYTEEETSRGVVHLDYPVQPVASPKPFPLEDVGRNGTVLFMGDYFYVEEEDPSSLEFRVGDKLTIPVVENLVLETIHLNEEGIDVPAFRGHVGTFPDVSLEYYDSVVGMTAVPVLHSGERYGEGVIYWRYKGSDGKIGVPVTTITSTVIWEMHHSNKWIIRDKTINEDSNGGLRTIYSFENEADNQCSLPLYLRVRTDYITTQSGLKYGWRTTDETKRELTKTGFNSRSYADLSAIIARDIGVEEGYRWVVNHEFVMNQSNGRFVVPAAMLNLRDGSMKRFEYLEIVMAQRTISGEPGVITVGLVTTDNYLKTARIMSERVIGDTLHVSGVVRTSTSQLVVYSEKKTNKEQLRKYALVKDSSSSVRLTVEDLKSPLSDYKNCVAYTAGDELLLHDLKTDKSYVFNGRDSMNLADRGFSDLVEGFTDIGLAGQAVTRGDIILYLHPSKVIDNTTGFILKYSIARFDELGKVIPSTIQKLERTIPFNSAGSTFINAKDLGLEELTRVNTPVNINGSLMVLTELRTQVGELNYGSFDAFFMDDYDLVSGSAPIEHMDLRYLSRMGTHEVIEGELPLGDRFFSTYSTGIDRNTPMLTGVVANRLFTIRQDLELGISELYGNILIGPGETDGGYDDNSVQNSRVTYIPNPALALAKKGQKIEVTAFVEKYSRKGHFIPHENIANPKLAQDVLVENKDITTEYVGEFSPGYYRFIAHCDVVGHGFFRFETEEGRNKNNYTSLINFHTEGDTKRFADEPLERTKRIVMIKDEYGLEYPRAVIEYKLYSALDPSKPFVLDEGHPTLTVENNTFNTSYQGSPEPGKYVFWAEDKDTWEEMLDNVRFTTKYQTEKTPLEISLPARPLPGVTSITDVTKSIHSVYFSEPNNDVMEITFKLSSKGGAPIGNVPGVTIRSSGSHPVEFSDVKWDSAEKLYRTTMFRSSKEPESQPSSKPYFDIDPEISGPGFSIKVPDMFLVHSELVEYLPVFKEGVAPPELVLTNVSENFGNILEGVYTFKDIMSLARTKENYVPTRGGRYGLVLSYDNHMFPVPDTRKGAAELKFKIDGSEYSSTSRPSFNIERLEIGIKNSKGVLEVHPHTEISIRPISLPRTLKNGVKVTSSYSRFIGASIGLQECAEKLYSLDKTLSFTYSLPPRHHRAEAIKDFNMDNIFTVRGLPYGGNFHVGFKPINFVVSGENVSDFSYGKPFTKELGNLYTPSTKASERFFFGRTGIVYGNRPKHAKDNAVFVSVDTEHAGGMVVALSTSYGDKLYGKTMVTSDDITTHKNDHSVQVFQFPKGTVANLFVPGGKCVGVVYAYDKDRKITGVYFLNICPQSLNPVLEELPVGEHHKSYGAGEIHFNGSVPSGMPIEVVDTETGVLGRNPGVDGIYIEQGNEISQAYVLPPYVRTVGGKKVLTTPILHKWDGVKYTVKERDFGISNTVDVKKVAFSQIVPGSGLYRSIDKDGIFAVHHIEASEGKVPIAYAYSKDADGVPLVLERLSMNGVRFEFNRTSTEVRWDYFTSYKDNPIANWFPVIGGYKRAVVVPVMDEDKDKFKNLKLVAMGTKHGIKTPYERKYIKNGFDNTLSAYELSISGSPSAAALVHDDLILSNVRIGITKTVSEIRYRKGKGVNTETIFYSKDSYKPTPIKVTTKKEDSDVYTFVDKFGLRPEDLTQTVNMLFPFMEETKDHLGNKVYSLKHAIGILVPVGGTQVNDFHLSIKVTNSSGNYTTYYPVDFDISGLLNSLYRGTGYVKNSPVKPLESIPGNKAFTWDDKLEYNPTYQTGYADGKEGSYLSALPRVGSNELLNPTEVSKGAFESIPQSGLTNPIMRNLTPVGKYAGKLSTIMTDARLISDKGGLAGEVDWKFRVKNLVQTRDGNHTEVKYHYVRAFSEKSTITASKKQIVGNGIDISKITVVLKDQKDPTKPPANLPNTLIIEDSYKNTPELIVTLVSKDTGTYVGDYSGYETGNKRLRFRIGPLVSESYADIKITPFGDDQDPANKDIFNNHDGLAEANPEQVYVFDLPEDMDGKPFVYINTKRDIVIVDLETITEPLTDIVVILDWGLPKKGFEVNKVLIESPHLTTVPGHLASWITDISGMFRDAKSFNQDISGWDTSNVTDMTNLFRGAVSFNQPLDSWDVSNVTNMGYMFSECESFNQDLNSWDTGNVTNMAYLFNQCKAFNGNISNWNTGKVTNMTYIFRSCQVFNSDVSKWNVGNVTNMRYAFANCYVYDQPLNDWDVGKVTNMFGMFAWAYKFNQPIGKWDMRSTDNLGGMMRDCYKFNQDLSTWCVSQYETKPTGFDTNVKVWTRPRPLWGTCIDSSNLLYKNTGGELKSIDLSELKELVLTDAVEIIRWGEVVGKTHAMTNGKFKVGSQYLTKVPESSPGWRTTYAELFQGAVSLNSDISEWDVSASRSFSNMFEDCKKFNQDISNWNMSNAKDLTGMFSNAVVFNQPIGKWQTGSVTLMSSMFNNSKAFNQDISRWNVSKVTQVGGMFYGASSFNQDLSTWCTPSLTTIPSSDYDDGATSWTKTRPYWGICPRKEDLIYINTEGEYKRVVIDGRSIGIGDAVEVVSWGDPGRMVPSRTINLSFKNSPLIKVPKESVKWTNNYSYLFEDCKKFNQDISNWDVSHVESMRSIFSGAETFNQPVGKWDVSNVYNLMNAFAHAKEFNQDLNDWDLSSLEYITSIFWNAIKFNGDISNWRMPRIRDLGYMFREAKAFNRDISGWDVSNVTIMDGMFDGARSFNQDLSSWCVLSIPREPSVFSRTADKWTEPKPRWGRCPGER